MRRRAAARQPRRLADRRAEPARLHTPVPDRPPRPAGRDRTLARAGESRRPARHARRQALRRNAQALADRPGARASAAPRSDGRADRRSRPAGAPAAVGAHRPAAPRGDDHPHVHALHRGGRAPRRHRADHVPRRGGCPRQARRPRARARGARGAGGLRPAQAARRGRVRGDCVRAEDPSYRHERLDPGARRTQRLRLRRASAGRRPWRTCSCSSPARRSPDGHRGTHREDRTSRAAGDHRRPRPRDRQLLVVLARRDVLVDGRADDLPARVRLRLRLARQHDQRVQLRRVRRHGDGGDGRPLLVGLRGDVRDVRQVPVPAHVRRDSRGAGRHGGAGHRRVDLDCRARRRLRLRADGGCDLLRARPELGNADRPVHQLPDRARVGELRDHDRRLREGDRELQLHRQRGADAALPARRHVLSARRPAQVAAAARRGEPAPPVRRARARSGALRLRVERSPACRACSSCSRSSCGGWQSTRWSAS